MYEIDKEKFGAFVAGLRKEKGYTQKELAQRLYISDKAVSKWETAVSIPDTALFIPLAEILGVSVTELLLCERMKQENPMDAGQVESIVKTAISYTEESPLESRRTRSRWALIYILSVAIGGVGLILDCLQGNSSETTLVGMILGVIFGAYFCFFAKSRLPLYYDENRIGMFQDGIFRINVPGIAFNNSNWPYVILVGRIWACGCTALYPVLSALMRMIAPEVWGSIERYVFLILLLGGLLIPMCVVAKKFE